MSATYEIECVGCGLKSYSDRPIEPSRICAKCGGALCVDCGLISPDGKLYCASCYKAIYGKLPKGYRSKPLGSKGKS